MKFLLLIMFMDPQLPQAANVSGAGTHPSIESCLAAADVYHQSFAILDPEDNRGRRAKGAPPILFWTTCVLDPS